MQGSTTGIILRKDSGLPAYRQLVDQLRLLIQTGRYREGEYLPVMREVAAEVGLNLNTVNRAYQQLQRDGLIRSTAGKGAVIVGRPTSSGNVGRGADNGLAGAAASEVSSILSAGIERAIAAGLTRVEVVGQVEGLLDEYARRFPSAPRIAIRASPEFRATAFARALEDAMGEPVGVETPESGESVPDVRVIVEPSVSGALEVLDEDPVRIVVPVHAHRSTVESLMEIEEGADVVAIAADTAMAQRIADAVSTLAAAGACRLAVADSSADASALEVAVIEANHPAASNGAGRMIEFTPAFASSTIEAIRAQLARRRE